MCTKDLFFYINHRTYSRLCENKNQSSADRSLTFNYLNETAFLTCKDQYNTSYNYVVTVHTVQFTIYIPSESLSMRRTRLRDR